MRQVGSCPLQGASMTTSASMTTKKPPVKYKDSGYTIQVGDRVEASIGNIYRRIDVVTRVTKTMAVCEVVGEKAPVRYPRVYESFGFHALPYQRTNMQYRVLDK